MSDQDRKRRRIPPGAKPQSGEEKYGRDEAIDKSIDDLLKADGDLVKKRKEESGE